MSTERAQPVRMSKEDFGNYVAKLQAYDFGKASFKYFDFSTISEVLQLDDEDKANCISVSSSFSQAILDQLTEKVYELYEMIDNADNDKYPNPLSEGSLRNSGMSLVRRIFYVANRSAINREIPISPKMYPYVHLDAKLNEFVSNLITLAYTFPTTPDSSRAGFRSVVVSLLVQAIVGGIGKISDEIQGKRGVFGNDLVKFDRGLPFAAPIKNKNGLFASDLFDGVKNLL